jgi:DNA replication protein DnaC
MSEQSIYQKARAHLAFLRMAAAAEALPAELEFAAAQKLGHTAFLERLLEVEVTAIEARRRASLERFASLASPFRLGDFDFDAQPSIDKKLVNELATLRFLPGCHQRLVDRATGRWQDDACPRPGPGVDRCRLPDLLHNGGRSGGPLPPGGS